MRKKIGQFDISDNYPLICLQNNNQITIYGIINQEKQQF